MQDQEFFRLNTADMCTYLYAKSAQPLQAINSSEISVVVQGPVFTNTSQYAPHGITKQVLLSLRQHLPDATLILATWKDQDVQGLDADVILQLDDPGTTNFYKTGASADNLYNNANRLIYSTQAGLEQVNTKYTLKIRSDLLMFHPLVTSYFNQFQHSDAPWQVLQQRIIGFPIYSLKHEVSYKQQDDTNKLTPKLVTKPAHKILQSRPFHVSDWAYFGLSTDLKQLFNCPLQDEPTTSRWFETHPKPANDIWPDRLWRYSPEQYITANLAQRTLGIQLEHSSQDDVEILQASERFVANNFMILDQQQWGLWSLKLQNYQDQLPDNLLEGLYSHQVWYNDYKKLSINTPTLMDA